MARRHAVIQRDPEGALLVVWACLVFVFYSLTRMKEPGAILPLLPACALLVAAEFEDVLDSAEGDNSEPMPAWIGMGLASLVFVFFLGLVFLKIQPAVFTLGNDVWKVVFDQSGTLALVLGIGIFVLVGVWGMRHVLSCLGGITLVQVLLLTSLASLAPELDAHQSSFAIAQIVKSRAVSGDVLTVHGLGNRVPSLDYYLRRSFIFQPAETLEDLMALPSGAWGVTDFTHWQSLRSTAPANTFQMTTQTGSLILFRKEK
jgi:hypothetical protein